MDMNRDWTQFAADAEVEHFGTARLVDAHNRLRVKSEHLGSDAKRLRKALRAVLTSDTHDAAKEIARQEIERHADGTGKAYEDAETLIHNFFHNQLAEE